MSKSEKVLQLLSKLDIKYELYEHPPVPTVEDALPYWDKIDATHCKNLFFRNHKGNRHYLVILKHDRKLNIRDLEQGLKQGKISFASPPEDGALPGTIRRICFGLWINQR